MTRPTRISHHRQAAVVGIHALPFSKNIGMTERHAGGLAVLGALADAGLTVAEVDGMFRFVWENTTEMEMARIRKRAEHRESASVPLGHPDVLRERQRVDTDDGRLAMAGDTGRTSHDADRGRGRM